MKLLSGMILTVAVLTIAAFSGLRSTAITAANDAGLDLGEGVVQARIQAQSGPTEDNLDFQTDPQLSGEGEKPFIGISVQTIDPEEDPDGGVIVLRVLPGGTADGKLQQGDKIVSIDGHPVTTTRSVAIRVRESNVGDELTFTVVRDGSTHEVVVEVGSRPIRFEARNRQRPASHQRPLIQKHEKGPDIFHRLLDQVRHLGDKFVRLQLVLETDEGLKTFTVVAGTVVGEVGDTTFTITLKDGSGEASYEISDDTLVIIRHKGKLGLSAGDEILVVDVDGNPQLVVPNDTRLGGRNQRPKIQVFKKRLGGHIRKNRDHDLPGSRIGPGFGRGRFSEGLEGLPLDLQRRLNALAERFEHLRPDLGDLATLPRLGEGAPLQ